MNLYRYNEDQVGIQQFGLKDLQDKHALKWNDPSIRKIIDKNPRNWRLCNLK